MQWWCKPGNCKPFCQKSLGRVCKKEISEFSVDFLIRDKNLGLWPISNYSQVGGFLQWSVTCIVTSVLISFDDTYSFANSELCHLNILTDSGFWVNSQPLLYQLALWRVFSWFQWNLRPLHSTFNAFLCYLVVFYHEVIWVTEGFVQRCEKAWEEGSILDLTCGILISSCCRTDECFLDEEEIQVLSIILMKFQWSWSLFHLLLQLCWSLLPGDWLNCQMELFNRINITCVWLLLHLSSLQ